MKKHSLVVLVLLTSFLCSCGILVKSTSDSSESGFGGVTVLELSSIDSQSISEAESLDIALLATGGDETSYLFSCSSECPETLAVDENSGQVGWTTDYQDAGEFEVVFSVTDGIETASTTGKISVENTNQLPSLEGLTDYEAEWEGSDVDFSLSATDEDSDSIEYACASECPSGLVVSKSGRVTWATSVSDIGNYPGVKFSASDGTDLVEAEMTFNIQFTGALTLRAGYSNQSAGGPVLDYDQGAIAGIRQVAISPDGASLYATSETSKSLTVFSRDKDTGLLTFLEFHKDNTEGGAIDYFEGVKDVLVSADGKNVYCASKDEDTLHTFSRNTTTGSLTHVDAITDGTGDLSDLDEVEFLELSPDGKFLYAAGYTEQSIYVFSRNSSTGILSYASKVLGGTVAGLISPQDLVVSPDGKHLYATAIASHSLFVFDRNETTGALSFSHVYTQADLGHAAKQSLLASPKLQMVSGIAISSDGLNIYTVSRIAAASATGVLLVWARDTSTGLLSEQSAFNVGGGGGYTAVIGLGEPYSIRLSPDDRDLYVGTRNDDTLHVFDRSTSNGALSYKEAFTDSDGAIVDQSVQGLEEITGIGISPDGKFIYAASNEDHAIIVFDRK